MKPYPFASLNHFTVPVAIHLPSTNKRARCPHLVWISRIASGLTGPAEELEAKHPIAF
jgi:hypothetical protein